MSTTILGILAWLSDLQGAWSFISRPAGWLPRKIRRRRGGVVKFPGFEFFPDRYSLEIAHGKLPDRLKEATTVFGIWVIGQQFFHAGKNLHVLKKLLLPNPDGESFKHYAKVSGHAETIDYIRGITSAAIKSGTKVKWYDHFIHHSILLVDTDKANGWVHLESVLPFSKLNHRPSYTIYKQHSEEVVREIQNVFTEMWDVAKDAPSN